MEGRATHSAIPAAVNPQLIPHKAEEIEHPYPGSVPTYLGAQLSGKAGGRPQPRCTQKQLPAAAPGPAAESSSVAGRPFSPVEA